MNEVQEQKTAHTPGPWSWEWRSSNVASVYRDAKRLRNHEVASVWIDAEDSDPERTDENVEADARLIAAAPALLDSLLAVEFAASADVGDPVDCCPNCAAPAGGFHYAHCELRDALDAALAVTSERVVHPAHAKEAARG